MSVTDYHSPLICDGCDNRISQSDDNAGAYITRYGDRIFHNEDCARAWAEEQPVAIVPAYQVLGWLWCNTCQRYPWDCQCKEHICTECELGPEDAIYAGPVCDATGGAHSWKEVDPESR